MKYLKQIVFILCSLLLATMAQAAQRNLAVAHGSNQEQKRVALVIGNAAYQGVSPLRNPVNDAHDMSNALNKLGFQVIEITDATQKEMNRAIAEFGSKLNADTAALFFYAGHGLQVKNKNYLVPVDAQINGEAGVRAETVDVDTVMDQLNVSSLSIVILDACRNNPFERSFRKMGGGLAQMDAPKGSFIAYATAPGKTAADGEGKNGLFTQELLKQINIPGMSLESVFKRVRANVSKTTGDAQMPWDSSSMTGDFYFKLGDGAQIASLVPVSAQPAARIKTNDEIEQDTWESVQSSNNAEAVAEYLKQYPKGRFVGQARVLFATLKGAAKTNNEPVAPVNTGKADRETDLWNEVQKGNSIEDYRAYLSQYPKGKYAVLAKGRLTKLETEAAIAVFSGPEMIRIPSKNYELGKYLVTQKEWRDVMGSNPSRFSNCGDTCPVERVSWNDIQEFLLKLNAKTGRQYRLPNEDEWEYACYGGSTSEYCGSNDINSVGWYNENSGWQTQHVGQKLANGYGLYDMSANVYQWIANKYDNEHDWRALRGGSWSSDSQSVRATFRYYSDPAYRDSSHGFRLARTLP